MHFPIKNMPRLYNLRLLLKRSCQQKHVKQSESYCDIYLSKNVGLLRLVPSKVLVPHSIFINSAEERANININSANFLEHGLHHSEHVRTTTRITRLSIDYCPSNTCLNSQAITHRKSLSLNTTLVGKVLAGFCSHLLSNCTPLRPVNCVSFFLTSSKQLLPLRQLILRFSFSTGQLYLAFFIEEPIGTLTEKT